jgi:hypothetical protein
MSTLHLRIADQQDIALLLSMMEPFNALEELPWDPRAKERALTTLQPSRSRQCIVAAKLARAAAPSRCKQT